MGTSGPSEVTMFTADESEDSVEINIKTMDSQTYSLRVNKRVPVSALKEQIATVTGVISEQQRLICRGKVLRDDQLLSAYHVEDGHTLHLVSRQPIPSPSAPSASAMGSDVAPGDQAFNSTSTSAHNRGNHVSHSVFIEAVNVDQGDRSTSSLSRIISSMLNTIAAVSTGTGNSRTDLRDTGSEGLDRSPGNIGLSDVTHLQPSSADPRVDSDSRQTAFQFPSTVNLGVQHPVVIPDSLTTIHQFLNHMRNEFRREAFRDITGELHNNAESSGIPVNEGESHDYLSGPISDGQGGLPSSASLAAIMLAARELLIEQAGGRLSQLASQLENQASVTDHLVRLNIQSSAMRSGLLLQNMGSLLLELGRTTMTLRMGQSPTETLVNAGPAVYISGSGPNPLMVQPVPFYPGSSFGGLHMGTANSSHGPEGQPLGSAHLPRTIDIQIHTGHAIPVASPNLGDQSGAQQSQEQTGPTRNSSGSNFIHQALSGASGSASFTGESGVRVVPVRVVAVPAGVSRAPSETSGRPTGLFYPLFARTQQQNSGNENDASVSQPSTEPQHGGPEIDRRQILESSMPVRDGNHIPTNPTLVFPGTNPSTNESHQYQGSSRIFGVNLGPPIGNNTGDTHAQDGQQTGQASVAEVLTRFHQWLRNIPRGEESDVSVIGHQETVIDSGINQAGTPGNFEAHETSFVGEDQGVFLSNLVRQLMPYISQDRNTVQDSSPTEPNSATEQTERENITDPSSSQHLRDPPEPPNSKRPKRE